MTDQPDTVTAWQDGHPLMEAMAAAVWERCAGEPGSGLVIDDPRNIAAAAYGAVQAAGIWDAARTATARQTGQQPDICACECQPVRQQDTHTAPAEYLHEAGCPAAGPDDTQPDETAVDEQCGKWGGCILDPGHIGPHRHTPRPASGLDASQPATDPRQPAYDAVYAHIRALGDHMPADRIHRNAMIWRAVHAALDAVSPTQTCVTHAQPATDTLVHVGWWCWRGDNHGHLTTTACRSDNVPLHAPTEWADEMRAVIKHLTDDHDPGEDCTWLSPEDQAAETLAAVEETDQ